MSGNEMLLMFLAALLLAVASISTFLLAGMLAEIRGLRSMLASAPPTPDLLSARRTRERDSEITAVAVIRLISEVYREVSDPVLMVDRNYQILWCNAQAAHRLEFPIERLLGQPLDVLIPPHLRQVHRDHFGNFFLSGVHHRLMSPWVAFPVMLGTGEQTVASISLSQIDTDLVIARMNLKSLSSAG